MRSGSPLSPADTLKTYAAMFRSWIEIATGNSYYHKPQDLGALFVAGELRGYFNDMRHKADWPGEMDAAGVPLMTDVQGDQHRFPTAAFQKGLGHWDRWLEAGEAPDHPQLGALLRISEWALEAQDDDGGFPWPEAFRTGRMTTLCSGMSQGEAASMLVRAHAATGDARFLDAAHLALAKLLQPVSEGGCSARVEGGFRLEEYPYEPPNTVLNGWSFCLVGLYDMQLVDPRPAYASALKETVATLVSLLPRYDLGYWTRYDLGGMVASPFYHRVHVAQMQALMMMFPEHADALRPYRDRFARYQSSKRCRARALARKVQQKLVDPPRAIY